MKPFNITEAKQDPSRIVYRDGSKPKYVFFADEASDGCKIITIPNDGKIVNHYKDGVFTYINHSEFDLFLQEQDLYVILDNKGEVRCNPFTDLDTAKRFELPFDTIYKLSKI